MQADGAAGNNCLNAWQSLQHTMRPLVDATAVANSLSHLSADARTCGKVDPEGQGL